MSLAPSVWESVDGGWRMLVLLFLMLGVLYLPRRFNSTLFTVESGKLENEEKNT
jgi:hypothetical protein